MDLTDVLTILATAVPATAGLLIFCLSRRMDGLSEAKASLTSSSLKEFREEMVRQSEEHDRVVADMGEMLDNSLWLPEMPPDPATGAVPSRVDALLAMTEEIDRLTREISVSQLNIVPLIGFPDDDNISMSLAHGLTREATLGQEQSPLTERSFGVSSNRAGFQGVTVIEQAGNGDPEALAFLWQLQNIVEDYLKQQIMTQAMRFQVNVGTRCAPGAKLYVVTMDDPLCCRIRLLRKSVSADRAEDEWEYAYEEMGKRKLGKVPANFIRGDRPDPRINERNLDL